MDDSARISYKDKMVKKIITHSGAFHADDVFAVATIEMLLSGNVSVLRSREVSVINEGDYVVDVGGEYDAEKNRFDHHQTLGAGKRASGIPYASFGLVWKKFGEEVSGSRVSAETIDRKLVAPIDSVDNGFLLARAEVDYSFLYDISDAISAFVPTWSEGKGEIEKRFNEAVFFARRVLELEIAHARALEEGAKAVLEEYHHAEDKRIIVLPIAYPWQETLRQFPEPLFAVYPKDAVWHVQAVRDDVHGFKNRKDFPSSWAGLRNGELAKISGVSDAVFCHRNLFMAVAKTREGAIALAKKVLVG